MEKTIFQKIIDREIPADIVYEDDVCISFLDIRPVNLGHTLVVSKNLYPWMKDVPAEELAHLFIASQKIMRAIQQATGCDLVVVSVVGNEVPHFHIHLIPDYLSNHIFHPSKTQFATYRDDDEKQQYVEMIKHGL